MNRVLFCVGDVWRHVLKSLSAGEHGDLMLQDVWSLEFFNNFAVKRKKKKSVILILKSSKGYEELLSKPYLKIEIFIGKY